MSLLFLIPGLLFYSGGTNLTENEHSKLIEDIGYKQGRPVLLTLAPIPRNPDIDRDLYLVPEAQLAWVDLLSASLQDGQLIKVNYAFRTHKQQRELRRTSRRWAGPPGWSQHQAGLAVDISGCVKTVKNKHGRLVKIKTPLFHWLKKNAPRYGFINTIKKEPWHWEYVPIKNASI
jgi:LAS superfamily LD-carboxypeptidase LdcB